jgi:hypothetical protein
MRQADITYRCVDIHLRGFGLLHNVVAQSAESEILLESHVERRDDRTIKRHRKVIKRCAAL